MFTEFTANSMTIGSFWFSERFRFVTVSVTVEPAGITAPLLPVTAFCTVAVNLSPTLLVFVQMFDVGESESVVPAAMEPTAPPPEVPGAGRETVLPLGVVVGVDGRVVEVLGREVDVAGRDVVRGVVFVSGADGLAGTFFNCSCAPSLRPASARSRLSAESRLSALVSCFELSALHAPRRSAVPSASGVKRRPVYFAIDPPPGARPSVVVRQSQVTRRQRFIGSQSASRGQTACRP